MFTGALLFKNIPRGTSVAQSVELGTLDFISGHDVRVVRLSPMVWQAPCSEGSLLKILSLCPYPLHECVCVRERESVCGYVCESVCVCVCAHMRALSLKTSYLV